MLKKSGIVKKIKIQKGNYSFPQEIYCILDMYKDALENKIHYSEYRLSPSFMGVKSYCYSVDINDHFNIECEVRDKHTPNLSKNYKFRYCALDVYSRKNRCRVYHAANFRLIRNIFLRMNQMYKVKNH